MLENQLPTDQFPYYGDEPKGQAKDAKKKATSLKTQTRVRSTKGKERDGDSVAPSRPANTLLRLYSYRAIALGLSHWLCAHFRRTVAPK